MTPAVKAFVEVLIEHYEARISDLESKIQKLTPQNSSLPPSTQHPHAKPKRPQRDGKKRKRGGQKGHQKHQRELIPSEQCDEVIPLQPDACRRCGTPLTGNDAEPIRHQVWELPEIKPIVTEYQQHRLVCRCCGITTCASLPPGVPNGQSGPRLVAFYRPADGTLSAKQTAGIAVSARSAEDALLSELDGQDAEPSRRGSSDAVRATAGRTRQASPIVHG